MWDYHCSRRLWRDILTFNFLSTVVDLRTVDMTVWVKSFRKPCLQNHVRTWNQMWMKTSIFFNFFKLISVFLQFSLLKRRWSIFLYTWSKLFCFWEMAHLLYHFRPAPEKTPQNAHCHEHRQKHQYHTFNLRLTGPIQQHNASKKDKRLISCFKETKFDSAFPQIE